MKKLFLSLALACCTLAGTKAAPIITVTDTVFDRQAADSIFAFGADISWLSELESWGTVFRNRQGQKQDLMQILKDQGLNSLRFRVWVNPANKFSGKDDVIGLCKRAHKLGFKIMIDFHYSDTWADPGSQDKPAAWANHSVDQLVQDVYDHTYDVLNSLKKLGIKVHWVQIGNETKRGMLWPEGNTGTSEGVKNFSRMINAGYDAVKAVDSTTMAIVHLPDGDENSLYRNMFDKLKKNGARWDIIGMSAYPRWSHLEPDEEIKTVIANMKDMIKRYNTKVMVVETGHYWHEPIEANNFLVEFMDEMMKIGALGCFYWEPESPTFYELGAWDPDTQQPTVAMDAYLGIRHTKVDQLIHVALTNPTGKTIFAEDAAIDLEATASHLQGTIAKVEFVHNGDVVGTSESAPYKCQLPPPGRGRHEVYARAFDTNGKKAHSDTIYFLVANAMVIQENEVGFCSFTNGGGTIDKNHDGYTGSGFMNGENCKDNAINFAVSFSEAGQYEIYFRHACPTSRLARIKVDGVSKSIVPFPITTTWEQWRFGRYVLTIDEPGVKHLSLHATKAEGLANIDYMAICPIEGQALPTAVDCEEASIDIFDTDRQVEIRCLTSGQLSIGSSLPMDEIMVVGVDGKLINNLLAKGAKQVVIDTPLNQGTYIVKVRIGEELQIFKTVVGL